MGSARSRAIRAISRGCSSDYDAFHGLYVIEATRHAVETHLHGLAVVDAFSTFDACIRGFEQAAEFPQAIAVHRTPRTCANSLPSAIQPIAKTSRLASLKVGMRIDCGPSKRRSDETPMAQQTYASLQQQITKLSAEADRIKKGEVAGTVARIKQAIAVYGLTVQDLFGKAGKGGISSGGKVAATGSKSKNSGAAKYADGKGGTWVGRGPRPMWLREAIASGRGLEEFAVSGGDAAAPATAATPGKKARKAAKKAAKRGFSDGAGNSWSGFGPKPRWLVEAMALSNKSMEEFRV